MKEILTIRLQKREISYVVRKLYELEDGTQIYISNVFPQVIRVQDSKVTIGKSVYELVKKEQMQ